MTTTPTTKLRPRCRTCGRFVKTFCRVCSTERAAAELERETMAPVGRSFGWLDSCEMNPTYGRIQTALIILIALVMIAGISCN